MTKSEYLSFIGKLFQLAAEFDLDELRRLSRADSSRGNAVARILDGLETVTHHPVRSEPPPIGRRHGNSRALRTLLASKELFPANEDLTRFLVTQMRIAPKDKESRDRLVGRIMAQLGSWPDAELESLRERLRERVGRDSSFVSKWSSVIKGL